MGQYHSRVIDNAIETYVTDRRRHEQHLQEVDEHNHQAFASIHRRLRATENSLVATEDSLADANITLDHHGRQIAQLHRQLEEKDQEIAWLKTRSSPTPAAELNFYQEADDNDDIYVEEWTPEVGPNSPFSTIILISSDSEASDDSEEEDSSERGGVEQPSTPVSSPYTPPSRKRTRSSSSSSSPPSEDSSEWRPAKRASLMTFGPMIGGARFDSFGGDETRERREMRGGEKRQELF